MGRIYLPYLNPLNLVEVNPAQVPQYLSKFMDDYRWADRLTTRQLPIEKFYQPWQNNDVIDLQFQSDLGQTTAYLVDVTGKRIDSFIATPKQQNKFDPAYFIYELHMAQTPYPEGYYVYYFEVGSPVITALVSEPIRIAPTHEGTLLFQYKHRQYRGNMIFETGIEPSIRVKGHILKDKPVSKDTLYEDQILDMTMLKSTPYRVFNLTLEQIPDWKSEVLNWVMGCSDVRIDGRYYTKNGDDAKWDKQVSAYFDALFDISLPLRESINRNSKVFSADENTNEELTIQLNVDSKGFADTSQNASSSVVTFIDVE
jgi:hypothetical protein